MKKRAFIFCVLLCMGYMIFFPMTAAAYQFEPITRDFPANGAGTMQTFTISNIDGQEPIAIKIEIMQRDMDINGNEIRTDASRQFFIYPIQCLVQPGMSQKVRIKWLGEADVQLEQAFRIIVQQLPVTKGSEGAVTMLVNYEGTLYVVPDELHQELRLVSINKVMLEGEEDPFLQLILENTGNTHTIIIDPVIELTSSDAFGNELEKVILAGERLEGFSGTNILTGKTRIYNIPWPEELPEGHLQVNLSIDFRR